MTDPVATIAAPAPADPTAIKPGLWTTEHIMAYVAILLTSLYGAGVIPTTGTIGLCFTIGAIALTSAGYSVTRGLVKSAAQRSLAMRHFAMIPNAPRAPQAGFVSPRILGGLSLAAILGLCVYAQTAAWSSGCATARNDAKIMSGSFKTCAQADLGVIVPEAGVTLLSDVAKLIAGNPATILADLTALGLTFGVDSVKCAIVAVEAVIAPTPAATGSAQLVTAAKPPGLVKALEWSAGH